MLYTILAIIILIVSFLFSMLGLGGALVYVPLFKFVGFSLKEFAIPLALLLNALTASIALVSYSKNKLVDWKGGSAMAILAFVFAPLGAMVSANVSTNLLVILFSIAIVIASVRMFLSSRKQEPEDIMQLKKRLIISGAIGAFAGFIAGLLGVGGGFIMAPLLMGLGYKTKQAAATSTFAVALSSFSGFLAHISAVKDYDWELTIILMIMVVIGAYSGSTFMAKKAKTKRIKQIFAFILLVIAVKMFLGVI